MHYGKLPMNFKAIKQNHSITAYQVLLIEMF
jgi:hypothetical protein